MNMCDELRSLTATHADGVTLYEAALNNGFIPMRVDGEEKVAQGLTDQAELYRVLH